TSRSRGVSESRLAEGGGWDADGTRTTTSGWPSSGVASKSTVMPDRSRTPRASLTTSASEVPSELDAWSRPTMARSCPSVVGSIAVTAAHTLQEEFDGDQHHPESRSVRSRTLPRADAGWTWRRG